ncbi:hypothetical protein E2562_027255 [Oryza meyeriana var. granulata]|uniref:Neprosin PEP catalytic domain-containing protein n=1 Tax=Oryza meyeriana var. granulata TaxID=110450 RepID=A0A6G1C8B8_9ORYZ|nr:hypothetical protein E2562_027255 [Oryza meyeriana var. granulata]
MGLKGRADLHMEEISRRRKGISGGLSLMIGISALLLLAKGVEMVPVIKSIKSEDGDIIDCVDIYKQPAFDHPLLKNHRIKMQPTGSFSSTSRTNNATNGTEVHQVWHKSGKCPNGTIPIRRSSQHAIYLHSSATDEQPNRSCSVIHHAGIQADGHVLGARADINIWRLRRVMKDEWSLNSVKIISSMDSFIQYGWMASPFIYGDDSKTRLFIRSVDRRSGRDCFNLMCPGFIQVSSHLALGATLTPLSKYMGVQYDISFQIHKDSKTGSWWALYNGAALGYWPPESLPASFHGLSAWWGGEVCDKRVDGAGNQTSTMMGNGRYILGGRGTCVYVSGMEVMDTTRRRRWMAPPAHCVRQSSVYYVVSTYKKYNASDGMLSAYYGGPGMRRPVFYDRRPVPHSRMGHSRSPSPREDPYKITSSLSFSLLRDSRFLQDI